MKFLYLIPLFPLLGFLFNFIVGVRVLTKRDGHGHDDGHGHGGGHGQGDAHHAPSPLIGYVACGAVLLSFLVAVRAVFAAHAAPDHAILETLWTWIPGGLGETAVHGTAGRHVLLRRLGLPGRPPQQRDAAGRHLRGLPDPRLLDRVHVPRPRLRALHGVPEPLHVRHAHPGAGGELRGAVRGLGGGGALQLPPHRVLVRPAERVRRGQEGLHRQPHRRRGLPARDVPDLPHLRQPGLPHRDGRGRPPAGGDAWASAP